MAVQTVIAPRIIFEGTPTYAEIAAGADGTATLAVDGARTEHLVHAEFSALTEGMVVRQPAIVSADGTITFYLHNTTASPITEDATVRGVVF